MVVTILDLILATKREEVAQRRRATSLADLHAAALAQTPPRGFRRALDARDLEGGYGLVAEIKRASPSKGLIRADFDPPAHAGAYAEGGAACLSVLTDRDYFRGGEDDLIAARAACSLPVLRKDFTVDPWQAIEARAIGADAVLIIMAALDDGAAAEIEAVALDLGMDVLVEVHDRAEMERAARLRSRVIGVNNRDLRDFSVDFARTYELVAHAPEGCTFVAESGLRTRADLDTMAEHGIRCFLIGESLMRANDIAAATRALVANLPSRLREGSGEGRALAVPADHIPSPKPSRKREGNLTHLDDAGAARMVDVSAKDVTSREAVATGRIVMSAEAARAIRDGAVAKGDVLAVARVAGIMAAKRTSEMIPLCHPLPLTRAAIDLRVEDDGVAATATVATAGRTGVEMEALTAVTAALLTVYDMAKAIDKGMTIEGVRLLAKTGGKSGEWRAEAV